MRNFDKERLSNRGAVLPAADRTFVVGGETFMLRNAVRADVLGRIAALAGAGANPGELLETVDSTIKDCILPDDHEKWDRVRAIEDEETLLTMDDLVAISQYVVSTMSGRPTGAPSVSSDGANGSGTLSTVVPRSAESTSTPLTSVGS